MLQRKKREYTKDETEVGLLLTDPFLFMQHFWKGETTIPEARSDLPEEWRGKQIFTLEQRRMLLDGWPYMIMYDRYPAMCDKSSQRTILRTSRKTGKTLSLEVIYIFVAMNAIVPPGEVYEGLMHAPAENQIGPVMQRIHAKTDKTPIFKHMHKTRKMDSGVDDWRNGWRWHTRIEGPPALGGKNMVGLRARVVVGDEGDYGGKAAFEERRQTALPQAYERWCGVPREGADSHFRTIARSPLTPWSKCMQGRWELPFRWDMRTNILYHSAEAWRNEMGQDNWDSGRVKTQVLGLDGGEGISVFPVVETVRSPWFRHIQMSIMDWRQAPDAIFQQLDIDGLLVALDGEEPSEWLVHCDYGFDPSPMEVGISFRVEYDWYEFARITAMRMASPDAAEFINTLDLWLPKKPVLIAFDAHGRGAGTYEILRDENGKYNKYDYTSRLISPEFHTVIEDARVTVHYKCKSSVVRQYTEYGPAWYCEACSKVVPDSDAGPMRVRSKQYYTVKLADAMRIANRRRNGELLGPDQQGVILAAEDYDLISELNGTTGIPTGQGGTQLKLFPPLGPNEDHKTDAWRCLARALHWIEIMGAKESDDSGLGDFGFFDTNPGRREHRARLLAHP